jgi:DNA transformation protein
MSRDRNLTDLQNIGKKIAARLEEAGIHSEAELRKAGPVEAHQRIKNIHPDETLPLCYYLYSFDGALKNKHWDAIGDKRKQDLKAKIGR